MTLSHSTKLLFTEISLGLSKKIHIQWALNLEFPSTRTVWRKQNPGF